MNQLLETGHITEMTCGANFAYVVSDNMSFLPTEYKVLQSQGNNSFVKSMKMLYNGKVQLFYLTSGYRTLSAMLARLDAESFLVIVTNLLADVIEVKNNGFLYCANIDISFDKIFVDPTTYKVKLIYLPLKNRIFDDISAFENELRTTLIKTITSLANLSSPKTIQLSARLADGTLTLDDLYATLKGGKAADVKINNSSAAQATTMPNLKIVALNAPMRVEIAVTKDEFILGKKQDMVDGLITFNKMISRSHCKIIRKGNTYQIVDLQSANGTYVNKVRLQPNIPFNINNGDVIRLANSDFQVVIE